MSALSADGTLFHIWCTMNTSLPRVSRCASRQPHSRRSITLVHQCLRETCSQPYSSYHFDLRHPPYLGIPQPLPSPSCLKRTHHALLQQQLFSTIPSSPSGDTSTKKEPSTVRRQEVLQTHPDRVEPEKKAKANQVQHVLQQAHHVLTTDIKRVRWMLNHTDALQTYFNTDDDGDIIF